MGVGMGTENGRNDLVGDLIDAAVDDPSRAERLLADHPDLIHARWIHDETPLHFLAIENYPAGARWLAEHGIDVNATNEFGDTALIDVLFVGNIEMAELLLALGANPNVSSTIG